jgi:ribosome-associated protein
VARAHRTPLPSSGGPDSEVDPAPSKTRRKAAMHALQDLGEALVALDAARLEQLAAETALPERLIDAIDEARAITAWGGRRRQLQFVGKLMRDVDPEPIRRRLDAWARQRGEDAARLHSLERWRERLLSEPAALDDLAGEHPGLDRPHFRALIARARGERERGAPPHAYRELYRELKALGWLTKRF